jgi:hypothetical protein
MSGDKHQHDGLTDDLEAAAASSGSGHEIDFMSFVMSLATSALMHLGEHDEGTEARPVDLPLAKQTIDVIGMLREKTRGNLSPDEERVVEGVLYDLRMRFLKASRG